MITAAEINGEPGDFAPKAPPPGIGIHVELIDELVRTQAAKPATNKAHHVLYTFSEAISPSAHDHLKVRRNFQTLMTFLAEGPYYFNTRDLTVADTSGLITYRMMIGW